MSSSLRLVIGNKCYSSWSMRPWLIMRHFEIAFEEEMVPLSVPTSKDKREAFAPSSTVPILLDGELAVWETLAIVEYLAETNPTKSIWPTDRNDRALARVLASEMHAGFGALRSACPMNLGRRFASRDRGEGVTRDVARIEELFALARERQKSNRAQSGPYLFGEFSAADAMFAPVCARIDGYQLPVSSQTRAYIEAVQDLPAYRSWRAAALEEVWTIDEDEVDEPAVEELRPQVWTTTS